MTDVSIRIATLDDTRAVAALRRDWTEEYIGRPVADDTFDERFDAWVGREAHQRITWLADHDGRAVGMLNMLVFTRMPRPIEAGAPARPTQWGYIANAFVAAAQRGSGIGSALVRAATRYADEHGFARLVLSPTEQARGLYERAGFGPATELMVRSSPSA